MAHEEQPTPGDVQRHPDRPDVFVSYAREDELVTARLVASLEARGKRVWIDRQEIPPAADWRERIGHGIDASRVVVFVVSPDSLGSGECAQELKHAISVNKRLIPVVIRDVDALRVPDELRRPNWIGLRDDDDPEASFEQLVEALETDLEWAQSHARMVVRAGEWTAGDLDRGFLLRGNDLRAAERWLAAEASHEQAATPDQRGYILASRRVATRRQLFTVAAVAVALVVSTGLGALAIVRAEQRQAALEQRQLSDSRQVAAEAGVLHTSRPDLSMLLGVQAFRIAPTVEARGRLLSQQAQRYAGTLGAGDIAIAFSPVSRTLATLSGRRGIELLNAATHAPIASIAVPGWTDDLEFSPDGRFLAAAGFKGVAYWDVRGTPRRLAGCGLSGTSVEAIAFSPDGETVATADDKGTMHLLAVPTCRVIKRFRLFSRFAFDVAFHPADPAILAAVGDHRTIKLLNVRTGARLASLPGNTSPVYSTALAFNRDGTSLASAGPNHTVRIWSTRSHRLLKTLRGPTSVVDGIAFSPDGRTMTTASGSQSLLWDLRTGHAVAALAPLDSLVFDVAFSADGGLLATRSSEGTIRLWKTRYPVFQNAFLVHRTVHSHDGRTLAVLDTNKVTLLDARSHERRMILVTANRGFGRRGNWDVAFSPDDRRLATVGRNAVKVWDLRTGAVLTEVTNKRTAFLTAVAFSRDGRTLATSGVAGPIVLLDAETGRVKARWKDKAGGIGASHKLIYTGDGRRLVAVGSGVVIWDVRTGRQLAMVNDPSLGGVAIASAAVSPNGHVLAGGRVDGSVVLWDLRTPKPRRLALSNLGGHTGTINGLAFNDDGRTLATAGEDGAIKLWDVGTTRRLTATLAGHRGPVNSVSFNRDGTLTSGSDDQTAISWDLDPARVSRGICGTLRTTLTKSDRARYVPSHAYGQECPQ